MFAIYENGEPIGKLTARSFVRTKWTLELNNHPTWTIHQPLFTLFFHGCSATNRRLWIQVGPRTKKRWNVLTQTGADSTSLLTALAFMHRQYWTH